MMKFFSVLKSRTSTAGFSGVIIVESSSTGVEISTKGNAGCMMLSTGCRFTSGFLRNSVYRCDSFSDPQTRPLRVIEIWEKSWSLMTRIASVTGRAASTANSSPETRIATRSRAVMPDTSRKPRAAIHSSLYIFAR